MRAKRFISIKSTKELKQVISAEKDFLLLGGGSNMLLLNDIEKLVIHIDTKGKEILKQDKQHVWVQVQAGENWHEFVLWCLENDFGGVENLALIPGNVGTAPIQNIGAYGVEVKDIIEEVHYIDLATNKKQILLNKDCLFGYRESIFKKALRGKIVITAVIFKLTTANHQVTVEYGAIQLKLAENEIDKPTIKDIANAVISIREEKLPNPKKMGNSGSFFKNPVISKEEFLKLKLEYPTIPNYPVKSNPKLRKIAAGWLVDQCGFKGKRIGDAGVHEKQALVLVNYGNATGKAILSLAQFIQKSVKEKFGVTLEMEVNIIE